MKTLISHVLEGSNGSSSAGLADDAAADGGDGDLASIVANGDVGAAGVGAEGGGGTKTAKTGESTTPALVLGGS